MFTLDSSSDADDTHKFYINFSGNPVAWLGSEGNIVLEGRCIVQSSCAPSANSFIIRNSSDSAVAHINETGDLCIEQGDCLSSISCNPTRDAVIVLNSSGALKSFIDYNGDLCYTGTLYEQTTI